MTAKVDSAALQDGYTLYHHTFVFTATAEWAVVQQGMSAASRYARRYHWLGERVATFVSEPHAAIVAERREPTVLNVVAAESDAHRTAIAYAAREERPETVIGALRRLWLPARHPVRVTEDVAGPRVGRILLETYERRPANFEALLGLPGVGARTLRALSLAAEVMYGVPGSVRDPAAYSFAHGGRTATRIRSTARPTTALSRSWKRPSGMRASVSATGSTPFVGWPPWSADSSARAVC